MGTTITDWSSATNAASRSANCSSSVCVSSCFANLRTRSSSQPAGNACGFNSFISAFSHRHLEVNGQQLADALMAAGAAIARTGGGPHIPNASQPQRDNRLRDHLLGHLQATADDAIWAARARACTRIGAEAAIDLMQQHRRVPARPLAETGSQLNLRWPFESVKPTVPAASWRFV